MRPASAGRTVGDEAHAARRVVESNPAREGKAAKCHEANAIPPTKTPESLSTQPIDPTAWPGRQSGHPVGRKLENISVAVQVAGPPREPITIRLNDIHVDGAEFRTQNASAPLGQFGYSVL